jgi:hypothetical protein
VDHSVNLLNDRSDLLGHSSVGLNDFTDLLDDWFDHFVNDAVGLVLEGGVFDLCGGAGSVTLLDIDSTAGSPEVDLNRHIVGVHIDNLRLRVVLVKELRLSQFDSSLCLYGCRPVSRSQTAVRASKSCTAVINGIASEGEKGEDC